MTAFALDVAAGEHGVHNKQLAAATEDIVTVKFGDRLVSGLKIILLAAGAEIYYDIDTTVAVAGAPSRVLPNVVGAEAFVDLPGAVGADAKIDIHLISSGTPKYSVVVV